MSLQFPIDEETEAQAGWTCSGWLSWKVVEPRQSGSRICSATCPAAWCFTLWRGRVLAYHTALCCIQERNFPALNIGISCACLELLGFFNLTNTLTSADHDFILATEYFKVYPCLFLLYFMLLYFVHYYKLLYYILIDIGNDGWIETHFKRRLMVLSSLELGSKQPWLWEKRLFQLSLCD